MAPPDASPDPQKFATLMALEPHGPDVYVGISPEYSWGRLYGGQVVAQALRAACNTVDPDHFPHSLHAYFIRGGTFEEPVRYEVDRIRNGRSFMTRRVVARQSGGAILNMSCSFQAPEEAVEIQTARMGGVPDPETVPKGEDSWNFLLDRRPFEDYPGSGHARGWVRLTEEIGDDPVMQACGMAFTSDTIQFSAARNLHPNRVPPEEYRDKFMGASLDHSLWFQRPVRADDWHLYDIVCDGLVGGRGITIGRVFSPDGTQVATMAQEVLLRELKEST